MKHIYSQSSSGASYSESNPSSFFDKERTPNNIDRLFKKFMSACKHDDLERATIYIRKLGVNNKYSFSAVPLSIGEWKLAPTGEFSHHEGNLVEKYNTVWEEKNYSYVPTSTLLSTAAHLGAYRISEFLLSKGAKVNQVVCNVTEGRNLPSYVTSLHVALDRKYTEKSDRDIEKIVLLLLKNGANPNFKSYQLEYGKQRFFTPLHGAVSCDVSAKTVEILCRYGADPNEPSLYDTPSKYKYLLLAISCGLLACCNNFNQGYYTPSEVSKILGREEKFKGALSTEPTKNVSARGRHRPRS